MSILSLGQFGFPTESCLLPAFPACKTENTMFLPGALLTAGLAEQVENGYPTLSCQCPNRCWLFQASLSGFLLAWLISCGGPGFLLGSKCSSAGHGAQARDYGKGENTPPAFAGLLQRAANSPTHIAAARHRLCSWHCRA